MILFLFFCSGATALIYEVVWSKYLALMLGSTVQAQTVVLAVFMGGLALGNRLFGARADASRQPLALYGYLEVAIGLYAFFFNSIYGAADLVFVAAGSAVLKQGALLLALKAGLSVALLIGPTILMGGTLPVLAAWLNLSSTDAGRRSARFYATNSLGAVCGAGLAGFVLVRELGMVSTLQMTALANVIIGIAAVAIARKQPLVQSPKSKVLSPVEPAAPNSNSPLALGCVLVALTGAVSMGLEVLASRSLTLIFGASLQAFAIVLMAFILGIGVGSSIIASPRWRQLVREPATIALIFAAAAVVGMLVMGIEEWVRVYLSLKSGLARTAMGYRFHQLLAGALSLVVLGVPAGLIGAVLPLWIRAGADGLGKHVGRLLTWNTLGAVGGSLLTGFVLMPWLGLRGAFLALAMILAVAAMLTAWRIGRRDILLPAAALMVILALTSAVGGEGWRHVLSSGVFRAKDSPDASAAMLAHRKRTVNLLFYEDAADATVSVEQSVHGGAPGQIILRVNGKPDATTQGDLATQYLLAHLPMLARPESKDVFVLGLGSGITAGAVLGHPVETLTIAENCEPVLRAAKFFEPWNRGVLAEPRTRVWHEDARTVLKLAGQSRFDVIISEPSNPWMAGVGGVFSREFYELCASRLKDGGVMTQWFHVYEMHDGIVTMVLRTFGSVFPHIEVWDPGTGDIILLGSLRPWRSAPDVYGRVFARVQPRQDLERIGLKSPAAVWARQLASQRTAHAIAEDFGVQSDLFPTLEYEAPKAFFLGQTSRVLFDYDERTKQSELAPLEKRAALATLTDEALRLVFEEFSSVNSEMKRYLTIRLTGGVTAANLGAFFENRPTTCIFFPFADAGTNRVEFPANAGGQLKVLLEAESVIVTQPARWESGVAFIQAILRAQKPGARITEWSPARFASVAARACLARRDHDRTRDMLDLGQRFEPDSTELKYLRRILDREQPSLKVAEGRKP